MDKENIVPYCHLYTFLLLIETHTFLHYPGASLLANYFILITHMLAPQSEMAYGFSQVPWEITFTICQEGSDGKQRSHFCPTPLTACVERQFCALWPFPIILEFPREELTEWFLCILSMAILGNEPSSPCSKWLGKAHTIIDMDWVGKKVISTVVLSMFL